MATKKRKTVGGRLNGNGKGHAAKDPEVTVKIEVTTGPDTPTYYINFAEVHHSQHEFGMAVVRTPGKMPRAQIEALKESGQLVVSADVLLLFPPTMLPGLIDALTQQRQKFEAKFGPINRGAKNDA